MLTRQQLEIINRKSLRYPLHIAEKDYFLALVLQTIAASSTGRAFIFKGGTALHHCYLEQYRFSEDLDFSSNRHPLPIEEVRKIFDNIDYLSIKKDYLSQATIKIEKQDKLYLKSEALFYKSAKQLSQLQFFTGYRSKTSGKEKEVDVKLAVDIVDYCYQNKFDNLYFCSGDADFNHALQIVKRFGKPIHLIGLETRIPMRLSNYYPTSIFTFHSYKDKKYLITTQQKIIFIPIEDQEVVRKL